MNQVTIAYDQDLKLWEESLKFEKRIFNKKAKFFSEQYENNFGQSIEEEFLVADFGIINFNSYEGPQQELALFVGGKHGLLYVLPVERCLKETNENTIYKICQIHMNEITSVKCCNTSLKFDGANLVLTSSKDGLIKLYNIQRETTLMVFQEQYSVYKGTNVTSANWSEDGLNIIGSFACGNTYIWQLNIEALEILQKQEDQQFMKSKKFPLEIKHAIFKNKSIHQDQINCVVDQAEFSNTQGCISKDQYGNVYRWIYDTQADPSNYSDKNNQIIVLGSFNSKQSKVVWNKKMGICNKYNMAYLGNDEGQIMGYLLEDYQYVQLNKQDKFMNKQIVVYNTGNYLISKLIQQISIPKAQEQNKEQNINQQIKQIESKFGYAITNERIIAFPLQNFDYLKSKK